MQGADTDVVSRYLLKAAGSVLVVEGPIRRHIYFLSSREREDLQISLREYRQLQPFRSNAPGPLPTAIAIPLGCYDEGARRRYPGSWRIPPSRLPCGFPH